MLDSARTGVHGTHAEPGSAVLRSVCTGVAGLVPGAARHGGRKPAHARRKYIGELCRTVAGSSAASPVALPAAPPGVNVTGYYAWTMWDNSEWKKGFTERFGLVHVDLQVGG